MDKPVFAVDVDLTVVDTLASWVDWFELESGVDFPWDRIAETSTSNLMEEHLVSPLTYWDKEDLYDTLSPMADAIESLEKLSQKYRIVFVTKSTAGHLYSKEDFLNKHFPFHSGIVHTGEKGLIEAEVFIDDFDKYIKKISKTRPEAEILFMRTRANLHQEIPGVVSVHNWREVCTYLLKHPSA